MNSLPRLEAEIQALAEERARGDAFETAVLAWLPAESELALRRAWRWADWPERARRHLPASDDGIDLVAEDTDGELVAVQVKFRSDPDRPVTREEAQKSLSYPDVFDRYLVVTNAWDRTRSATRGLAGEGRLSWVLRPHRPQVAHARDPRQRRPASGSGASYRTAVTRTVPTPRTIGIIVT